LKEIYFIKEVAMKRKIVLILIMVVLFLAGCNELEAHKKEALKVWEKGLGDKYSVHMFTENKSFSYEVETILKLKKYKAWDSLYTHRYNDNDAAKIHYLKAFNEKNYPFYLIVSKNGVVIKTTSVNDVVHFFEKNGGGIDTTR
jgi:hypothetical protein